MQRAGLILAERERDEFGQANRVQEASANAAWKRGPDTGQDRQTCPERIRRGGMRVARKRIEEKISQRQPCQMVLQRLNMRCEDKPFGCNSASACLGAKIAPRRGLALW